MTIQGDISMMETETCLDMTLKGQSEHLENGASCPSTIVGEEIPPSLFAV